MNFNKRLCVLFVLLVLVTYVSAQLPSPAAASSSAAAGTPSAAAGTPSASPTAKSDAGKGAGNDAGKGAGTSSSGAPKATGSAAAAKNLRADAGVSIAVAAIFGALFA